MNRFKRIFHGLHGTFPPKAEFGKVVLTRHGSYNSRHGRLTSEGREQAAETAVQLRSMNLGNIALATSTAPRAMETAEIIGSILGVEVRHSEVAHSLGETAGRSEVSFDKTAFVAEVVADAGLTPVPESSLVLVTHAPAIAEVFGLALTKVEYAKPYVLPVAGN